MFQKKGILFSSSYSLNSSYPMTVRLKGICPNLSRFTVNSIHDFVNYAYPSVITRYLTLFDDAYMKSVILYQRFLIILSLNFGS